MALCEPALLIPNVAVATIALVVVKASSCSSVFAAALTLGMTAPSCAGKSVHGSAGQMSAYVLRCTIHFAVIRD